MLSDSPVFCRCSKYWSTQELKYLFSVGIKQVIVCMHVCVGYGCHLAHIREWPANSIFVKSTFSLVGWNNQKKNVFDTALLLILRRTNCESLNPKKQFFLQPCKVFWPYNPLAKRTIFNSKRNVNRYTKIFASYSKPINHNYQQFTKSNGIQNSNPLWKKNC